MRGGAIHRGAGTFLAWVLLDSTHTYGIHTSARTHTHTHTRAHARAPPLHQVYWTREVAEAIEKGGARGLTAYAERCTAELHKVRVHVSDGGGEGQNCFRVCVSGGGR